MRADQLPNVVAFVLVLGLSACSEQQAKSPCVLKSSGPMKVQGFDLTMSNELDCEKRTSIETSLKLIDTRSLQVSNQTLEQALGGNAGSDIKKYLNERVKFISGQWLLDEAEKSTITPLNVFGADNKSGVVASNLGIALWLHSMANFSGPGKVTLQGKEFKLNSGRVGIIVLGDAFNIPGREDFNRLLTLLHEARHSDCTTGLDETDLSLIQTGNITGLQAKNPSCGHLHEDCPAGHDLEGVPACDSHAWGAYSMSWVFAQNFLDRCDGCTELEKETLSIAVKDARTRLINENLNAQQTLNLADMPTLRSN